ncbi:MAG: TasA family protein [Angelakisella sp.]
MNTKKLIVASSALVLAASLIAGGTYAYFTDSKAVGNVVTFGNVKISLTEPGYKGDGAAVNVVPGASITKDPTITNVGNNPCYVRAKVDVVETYLSNDAKVAPPTVAIEDIAELNTTWKKSGDYYYCQTPLSATDAATASSTLFGKLNIPTAWGNNYADLKLKIDISAEAIQSENFDPIMNGTVIIGWHEGDVPAKP